jgi:hypothetical protein
VIRRRREDLNRLWDLSEFESRQRTDRIFATFTGVLGVIAFIIARLKPHEAFEITLTAASLIFVLMGGGIIAQDRTVTHAIRPILLEGPH